MDNKNTQDVALGYLAHEIKNLMSVVKMRLQTMELENPDVKFEEVFSDINKVDVLLKNYMKFFKDEISLNEDIDLVDMLTEICNSSVIKSIMNEINIDVYAEFGVFSIKGDYILLYSAFLNVVKNAIESMKGTGSISIYVDKFDDKINIKFSDTGRGMDNATLCSVFTTFKTTKKNGNGLGMHFVKKVVEGHKGNISIASKLNKGTDVLITF